MAARTHNKAALIASDCGMSDLARSLCWRQFSVFATASPLTVDAAQFSLQPLINLGRLLIRAGDGGTAYCLFEDLYRAVRDKTNATIDGKSVDLGDLIRTGQDTRGLITWLWSMLLADGTRALVAEGRIDDAVMLVKKHKGIGQRLSTDGRS